MIHGGLAAPIAQAPCWTYYYQMPGENMYTVQKLMHHGWFVAGNLHSVQNTTVTFSFTCCDP